MLPSVNKGAHGRKRANWDICFVTFISRTGCPPTGDNEENRANNMVQDNCVVHVDKSFPVEIGDYVTIGHGAIIHGCKIGNNTLIGIGAIIQNGAIIGKNCMIGAGAVITQNIQVPDNTVMVGCPAKAIREVTEKEIASNRSNAEEYIIEGKNSLGSQPACISHDW